MVSDEKQAAAADTGIELHAGLDTMTRITKVFMVK